MPMIPALRMVKGVPAGTFATESVFVMSRAPFSVRLLMVNVLGFATVVLSMDTVLMLVLVMNKADCERDGVP